jgi:hypothetical protein
LIQKNISYYADPFKNFDIYSNYDLNNLLLFITSKINGGIASCCECFSGLVYGSSDYNFFMLDLQNEFIECNYKTPSGCGPILFDERIIFTNCALLNPLSYRTKNGCCYNYIIPVSHNLCLTYSGNNFLESKNINSNLNCKKINLRFCAGEFDFFSLYDIGNFITGSGSGYLNNSYLYSFNNTNSIYINNCSLQSISGNKNLSICKSYYFTGVQPIYIESNYPLLDLKSPIKNIYLNEYEYSDLAPSGIYYYTYNLANITKHNIRFSSPEMTKINTISWKDASQEARGVSILNKNLSGKIQDNVAIINFDITGALSCNSYYYDSGIYYICINIVGGL